MNGLEVSLQTAGTRVRLRSDLPATLAALGAAAGIADVAGGGSAADMPSGQTDLSLQVDREHHPFGAEGLVRLTRNAWTDHRTTVVLGSAGGSGWAQRWSLRDLVTVHSRWTPSPAERAAALMLPARRRALEAQVLLHHPALWTAARRGLAPLHASVLDMGGRVVLLAGPGGLGKSTLVARELVAGAKVCCDNVAVSDGRTTWGLAEPLRLDDTPDLRALADGTDGARTTHGRREITWDGRVPALRPDVVVVVRRGDGPAQVREVSDEYAARHLAAGTFAAGELMRFWPLCAVLGIAFGGAPVLPDVMGTARRLASELPCLEVVLGPRPGPSLHELLGEPSPISQGTTA